MKNIKFYYLNSDSIRCFISCDFLNGEQLNQMIKSGVVKILNHNEYEILDENLFTRFYNNVSVVKNEEIPRLFLELCYQMFPNNTFINLQMFFNNVKEENYEGSIYYLSNLLNSDDKNICKDALFYTYLLSFLINLPEDYKKKIKDLVYEDIMLDDSALSYVIKESENRIRLSVLYQRYSKALKLEKTLIQDEENQNAEHYLPMMLISMIIEQENLSKRDISHMIGNKQYIQAITFLEEKQDRHPLNDMDYCTLQLLYKFMYITNNYQPLDIIEGEADDFYEKIAHNDFRAALLSFYVQYEDNKNYYRGNNMGLLLKTIIDLNDDKKLKFLRLLRNQNLEELFEYLKEYLRSINKENYEAILINLIRIDNMNHNQYFTEFFKALKSIENNTIIMDYNYYKTKLKESSNCKNKVKMEIYEDILSLILLEKEFTSTVLSEDESYPIEEKSIKTKINEIRRGTKAVIIGEFNQKGYDKIKLILDQYPSIVVDSYDLNMKKVVFIREIKQRIVDIEEYKSLVILGRNYLEKHQISKALRCYSRALDYPAAGYVAYLQLGRIYSCLKDYCKAVDFLSIADGLAKSSGLDLNIQESIEEINRYVEHNKSKSVIFVEPKNSKKVYRSERIVAIEKYTQEHNIDVESACKELGFTEGMIIQTFLELVLEYYKQGSYEQGDLFYDFVRKNYVLSASAKRFAEYVIQLKNFYKTTKQTEELSLSLILKPRL